jgi:hypothetical protein
MISSGTWTAPCQNGIRSIKTLTPRGASGFKQAIQVCDSGEAREAERETRPARRFRPIVPCLDALRHSLLAINCKLSVIGAVVRFRGAQMVAPLQHLVSNGMTIARMPDRLSIARRPRGSRRRKCAAVSPREKIEYCRHTISASRRIMLGRAPAGRANLHTTHTT